MKKIFEKSFVGFILASVIVIGAGMAINSYHVAMAGVGLFILAIICAACVIITTDLQ